MSRLIRRFRLARTSDETGIIVAGLGVDDHGYILEDASGKYSPAEWARRVVSLYGNTKLIALLPRLTWAGCLLSKRSDLFRRNVSYRGVHAKRGKMIRAEPISALYEQSKVHHVGIFEKLEDQLCSYAGGGDFPDRLDAMVYALSELMVSGAAEMELFPPECEDTQMANQRTAEFLRRVPKGAPARCAQNNYDGV